MVKGSHECPFGAGVATSAVPPRAARRRMAVLLAAMASAAVVAGCDASGTAFPESADPATPPTTPPTSAAPVLADDGIGGLRLGMSAERAKATGLLGPLRKDLTPDEGPDACQAFAGKRGVDLVYLSGGRVVIITVTDKIRTAGGVGVGDTYQTLHDKHPEATASAPGRLTAPAPGAPVDASYRFGTDADDSVYPDSKITEIALQTDDQPCYE